MRDYQGFFVIGVNIRTAVSGYTWVYEANAPFDRQRQYAAPQFPHPLSSGKSGQFFEEPSQETLESQNPLRSGAFCHLHKLLFP